MALLLAIRLACFGYMELAFLLEDAAGFGAMGCGFYQFARGSSGKRPGALFQSMTKV